MNRARPAVSLKDYM